MAIAPEANLIEKTNNLHHKSYEYFKFMIISK